MFRRIAAVMLVAAIAFVAAPMARADLDSDLSEVQARIERLRSQVGSAEAARSELAAAVLEVAAELETVVAQLREAEDRLATTEAEIAATEQHIAEVTLRLEVRGNRVVELRVRAEDTRDEALGRLVEIYMTANSGGSAEHLLVDDVSGVGIVYAGRAQTAANRVIASFTALRAQEQREIDRIGMEQAELEDAKSALEEQRAVRAGAAADVAAKVAEVEERLAAQEALLAEMDREIALIEGEIAALAREEENIEQLIREEQSGGGSSPGILARPVPGGVSSGFGYRIHPIYGSRRMHTGWDMSGGCGEPIKAGAGGRVFLAGWNGGYGNTIMIDHGGGMATLYAHQSSFAVGYGQQVTTGQVIGYVGTTGVSTGCHLHFEVRISGSPVDPSPYL